MQSVTVRRILRHYGYEPSAILPVAKGYRNESHPACVSDGTFVNFILYKDEPDIRETIRRVHAVSSYLANAGFAVRRPIEGRIMTVSRGSRRRYGALYSYLAGSTIPWEAYTQKHLKLLGKTLGDMHGALALMPTAGFPDVAAIYLTYLARMQAYFADRAVRDAMHTKLQLAIVPSKLVRAASLVRYCGRLPRRQVLHMDFVRSNVLFAPDPAATLGLRVSGILDFEKTAYGIPPFDIARTLAFLLVDCKYKSASQVGRYFLDSGYRKRGAAQLAWGPNARRLLDELVTLFLMYDFYKFLRHNPYEFLHQNEHFLRTRDILLARGVITTTTVR